jgi:hypothetical protein
MKEELKQAIGRLERTLSEQIGESARQVATLAKHPKN